jgi:prophage regulatory protein
MAEEKILRWPDLHSKIGLCRSQISNLVRNSDFPKPIKLGQRASGWLESEVSNWLVSQIEKSRVKEDES